jgi:5'-methylthioadenosine phosphorylase
MEGLHDVRAVAVATPFGAPSDRFVVGRLGEVRVAFLPRHGRGHRLSPSELPFRANVFALKSLGVEAVIAVSAVGSLRAEIAPGQVVIPDQFIDRTYARASTFFGNGVVAHVSFADPVCPPTARLLARAARGAGATVHNGGTYVCIEGPQFSTRAESRIYRSWGVDVIGMTNLQEAKLSREAEICYATMALVTDYDVWHETEGDVSVEKVVAILHKNVATAKAIIRRLVPAIPRERSCICSHALKDAIITAPKIIPEETKKKLALLVGKYLD